MASSMWTPQSKYPCAFWCGLFYMVLVHSVLLKGNLNATAYNDISECSVLPTLWQQFRFCPSLFLHDKAAMHKVSSIRKWFSYLVWRGLTDLQALTSAPSNTFGVDWNMSQTSLLCWTSLMLLRLNGSKSLQPEYTIWCKAWNQKSKICLAIICVCDVWVSTLFLSCSLCDYEWNGPKHTYRFLRKLHTKQLYE